MIRLLIVLSIIICCAVPVSHSKESVYHGTIKELYPDGTIKSFKQYKKGKLEGYSKEYFPSGRLAFIQTVKNGKINGPVKAYYENGVLRAEIQYVDNLEQGLLKEYYENGKLKEEVSYINGEIMNLKTYDLQGGLTLDQDGNFPAGCKVVAYQVSQ